MRIRPALCSVVMLAALPFALVSATGDGGANVAERPVASVRPAPPSATPPAPAPAVMRPVDEPPAIAMAERPSSTTRRMIGHPPTAAVRRLFRQPYHAFSRQHGKRAWWNRRSGIAGADWVYPYFPAACYQTDAAAGGTSASAWQVLWVYPDNQSPTARANVRDIRLMVRGTQSLFAASARRYLRNQRQLFARSLAPRFVTTAGCQADVRPVRVPSSVYNTGNVWDPGSSATPFGAGTLTEWLLTHGFNAPNRKYLVFLQSSPAYAHTWTGISEDPANSTGTGSDETPTRDNPANYTSFSYVDLSSSLSGGPGLGDLTYPTQVMAHEMTHALGAMTASAPHENAANPLHPTDCWDLLCYNPPTKGQSYANGCGGASGWMQARLARGYLRLDCNRDDYWAPATDSGLPAAAWTARRWAVSSSSFLYGNAQPTPSQLRAHQR